MCSGGGRGRFGSRDDLRPFCFFWGGVTEGGWEMKRPAVLNLVTTAVAAAVLAVVCGWTACKEKKVKQATKTPTKPADIKVRCVMDGNGRGHCTFTNKGEGSGTKCIKVKLWQTVHPFKKATSIKFCSGKLAPKATKEVVLSFPEVEGLCLSARGWGAVCDWKILKKLKD